MLAMNTHANPVGKTGHGFNLLIMLKFSVDVNNASVANKPKRFMYIFGVPISNMLAELNNLLLATLRNVIMFEWQPVVATKGYRCTFQDWKYVFVLLFGKEYRTVLFFGSYWRW